ncbi:MAG: hypothetical protein ABIG11_02330, partial [bacterium]
MTAKTGRKNRIIARLSGAVAVSVVFCLILAIPGFSEAVRPGKKRVAGKTNRFAAVADSMRPAGKKPSAGDRKAFDRFTARHPGQWRVRYSPRTALPESVVGGKTARYAGQAGQAAKAFLEENRSLLQIEPSQIRLERSVTHRGITHLQYAQIYNGVPVEFSHVKVHVSDKGEILGVQSRFEPSADVPLSPSVSASAAASAAAADLGSPVRGKGVLVLFPDEKTGRLRLAWKFRANGSASAPGLWYYYIDAHSGEVIFRYDNLRRATTGSISGMVYDVDPDITPGLVSRPIANQYVWIAGTGTVTVTDAAGAYNSVTNGKISCSLKGPYFSVVNFRGTSAHFDNGGGVWRTKSTPAASPHPYADSLVYSSTVTLIPSLSGGEAFAKAVPYFTSFQVGEMDLYSNIIDGDELHVINPANGSIAGSYMGRRISAFEGPPVENTNYVIDLRSDASGSYEGYAVDISRYLVLTNSPDTEDNGTGSFTWTTDYFQPVPGAFESTPDEVNAFYHLNKMRDFFNNGVNSSPQPVDLGNRVPVMMHAHGDADYIDIQGGMENAFYNPEAGNMFFGDGEYDVDGVYKSYALDGTVVRHEYIHYVVDRIYPIINFGEFGALSEALADYFPLSSLSCAGPSGCSPVYNKVGGYVAAG